MSSAVQWQLEINLTLVVLVLVLELPFDDLVFAQHVRSFLILGLRATSRADSVEDIKDLWHVCVVLCTGISRHQYLRRLRKPVACSNESLLFTITASFMQLTSSP